MSAPDAERILVLLGLGSNLGDRLAHLRAATRALADHPGLELVAVSRIWESEHVGPDAQEPYLNACAALRTALGPLALLDVLKGLEAAAGRPSDGHRRPRPIDLDILLFGDRAVADGRLRVPHPEMSRRAFVLEPLAEIAGGSRIPDSGETVGELCAKIRRKSGPWVRPYDGGDLQGLVPGREQGGTGCCPGLTSSLRASSGSARPA